LESISTDAGARRRRWPDQSLDLFEAEHVNEMDRCGHRLMILLIDFDNSLDWVQNAQARIPQNLANRVFVLGALTNPEDLTRARLGSLEGIGRGMADDCRNGTNSIWSHRLLQQNAGELNRLRPLVKPMLF
jgi:hypothetical protein